MFQTPSKVINILKKALYYFVIMQSF